MTTPTPPLTSPPQAPTHHFVCPACKGPLTVSPAAYACDRCPHTYPIVLGIPDFRLETDPFITIADDRAKAQHLHEQARTRTFAELVRYYYSITPEDPPDLAERWTQHHFAEVDIAAHHLADRRLHGPGQLLDLGCSTGAMLIAASRVGWQATGIDVALRWMIIGRQRLAEAGVAADFVCANAMQLPFADDTFDLVTGTDLLEHVRDPRAALGEARRVVRPGGGGLFTANNRFAPLFEPQMRLWGVGYLPRSWQRRYVAWRRPDVHVYRLQLPSAGELKCWCHEAGWPSVRVTPGLLSAPHVGGTALQAALGVYNSTRQWPVIRGVLSAVGPKLTAVTATRGR